MPAISVLWSREDSDIDNIRTQRRVVPSEGVEHHLNTRLGRVAFCALGFVVVVVIYIYESGCYNPASGSMASLEGKDQLHNSSSHYSSCAPSWTFDGSEVVGPDGRKGIISYKIKWEHDSVAKPILNCQDLSQIGPENAVRKHDSQEERHSEESKGEKSESDEEEKEGELEESRGEVEIEYSAADVEVSCMLLGSVSFVLCLFHWVRFPDDDIRRYAWQVISDVISIFVAVLFFNCANGWVLEEAKNFQVHDVGSIVVIQYIHTFLWILMCQLVLAFVSGTICEGPTHSLDEKVWVRSAYIRADFGVHVAKEDVHEIPNNEIEHHAVSYTMVDGFKVPCECKKANLERRNRALKCWGVLFAHIAGFAAVRAGGTMQQLECFSSSPWVASIPILINQGFITILFAIFNRIRDGFEAQAKAEGRKGTRARMYDEEVQESENEISALCWSYLLVKIVKFLLVGELPTLEGETSLPNEHVIAALYVIGCVFGLLAVLFIKIRKKIGIEEEHNETFLERFMNITIIGFSLSFAWCFLYSSKWLFQSVTIFNTLGVGGETVLGRILLALLVSIVSMILLFGVDAVSDTLPSDELTVIVEQIVLALSLLAGLSWEHAFDGGVEALASTTRYPMCTATGLAAFVLVIVVPAWVKFILKTAMDLKVYAKRLKDAAEKFKNNYAHLNAAPSVSLREGDMERRER